MQDRYATGLADPVQMYDQRDALRNAYQNNPYQGMGQQPLRVSAQNHDNNQLQTGQFYAGGGGGGGGGGVLSNLAKGLGFK